MKPSELRTRFLIAMGLPAMLSCRPSPPPSVVVVPVSSSTEGAMPLPLPPPPASSAIDVTCRVDEAADLVCVSGASASDGGTCPREIVSSATPVRVKRIALEVAATPTAFGYAPALTERFRAAREIASDEAACCYARCAALPVRETGVVAPMPIQDPFVEVQSYCFEAPASGTSAPAPAPNEMCPAAIEFGPNMIGPGSHALDAHASATRSGQGGSRIGAITHACCYTGFYRRPPMRGRLFRVDGEARVAASCASAEWNSDADLAALADEAAGLDDATRAALAERWTRDAALEHASVAAFARISLQLLAWGAPPELVSGAHEAALDEIAHARGAWAIASVYAGAARGPGPLAIGEAERAPTWAMFARETLIDGCLGETVATLEASAAAREARSDAVRSFHVTTARDEARHAELAFRILAWATRGAEGASVRDAIARACDELAADPIHGDATRAAAIRDVVLPCAAALVATS